MDMLDRLLGHDEWTTTELLRRCRELTDEQLDRAFDAGVGSVRATLAHAIGNVETWTDLMLGREPRVGNAEAASSIDALTARHDREYGRFAALARAVCDEGRLDELWTDTLDNPPRQKTYGGAIGHVITHNHFHRAELLHMLQRLGLTDLPEGDLLSWEWQARNHTP